MYICTHVYTITCIQTHAKTHKVTGHVLTVLHACRERVGHGVWRRGAADCRGEKQTTGETMLSTTPQLPLVLVLHSMVCCTIRPSIYLPTYLSICLSIYLSIYLSVYLSIYLSIYLSCRSACLLASRLSQLRREARSRWMPRKPIRLSSYCTKLQSIKPDIVDLRAIVSNCTIRLVIRMLFGTFLVYLRSI